MSLRTLDFESGKSVFGLCGTCLSDTLENDTPQGVPLLLVRVLRGGRVAFGCPLLRQICVRFCPLTARFHISTRLLAGTPESTPNRIKERRPQFYLGVRLDGTPIPPFIHLPACQLERLGSGGRLFG